MKYTLINNEEGTITVQTKGVNLKTFTPTRGYCTYDISLYNKRLTITIKTFTRSDVGLSYVKTKKKYPITSGKLKQLGISKYDLIRMENKNQYEEIIDKMMIDEISTLDGGGDEIREYIESCPLEDKRLNILSILDKDRRIFDAIEALILDETMTPAKHVAEIVKMLRDYVKVGLIEKKRFGEVMTPQELVVEILSKLPKHIWSNPNLKWLDPCNGVGIFPAIVISMLMDGLSEWEPDEELRYKHIIENMIFVCELQPRNMFLFLCGFDPKDKYGLNIYTGSFLDEGFDEHMKNVWGLDGFDICMGNPPYQWKRDGEKKSHPLWHLFVNKGLSVTIEGGYICMVHPGNWREIDGKFKETQKLMLSKQILFLKMNTYQDGFNTFGAKIDFDFYVIKNAITNGGSLTHIIDIDGEVTNINIKGLEYIPNCKINEVLPLIAKNGEEKVEILHSYSSYETRKNHMSKGQTEEFIYPCTYTVKAPSKNNELTFWYSSTKGKGHFGTPKVIWGNGASGVSVDSNGDYGLTQFTYGIVDDVENLLSIKKVLLSDYFVKYIMSFRNSLGSKYKHKIISNFRKDFWKEFLDADGNIKENVKLDIVE